MGIVWEASPKGVPLLGVPGITLDKKNSWMIPYYSHIFRDSNMGVGLGSLGPVSRLPFSGVPCQVLGGPGSNHP